jgi:predicted Zn-dependent peptidase
MIRRTAFASGLRVVSERMPGVRSVALGFWVLAGSRDEPPAISGSSHFLEHLLFKGTSSRSAQDIAEAFDAVGGNLNAYTSKETTVFHARILDRDLPMAVAHLADMFRDSTLRPTDLEAERQVILEEINMYEDAPDELVHDLFQETLWPDHPLGRPILGTRASIAGASRAQVRRFYREHYRPGNLVVAAAGSVDHDALVRLVRRHLDAGRVARGGADARPRASAPPPPPSGRTRIVRRPTEQAHIVVGTNGPTRSDEDRFAFAIANTALGGGMSSRLFQEVREKRGLAYSVYSQHAMYADAGLFSAYAGTTPARAQEVLDLMRAELADVARGGLTREEFERAKGHTKGSIVLSLENPGSRMSRLGRSEISEAERLTVTQLLRRFDAVTLRDARAAAERALTQPLALTVLGPFSKGAVA